MTNEEGTLLEGRVLKGKEGSKGPLSQEEIQERAKHWNACVHWIHSKQRFCHMARVCDKLPVCGEHFPVNEEIEGNDGSMLLRVPCPLDPTHTCFKHLMDKHLVKCSNTMKEDPPLPYIEEDVNVNFEPNAYLSSRHKALLHRNVHKVELTFHQPLYLKELLDEQFSELIERIVRTHEKFQLSPKINYGNHPIISQELCRSDIGDTAAKHLCQVGSLINILDTNNLIKESTAFIEYGGGRGTITYPLAKLVSQKKLANCKFFVIDKFSPRHKLDNKLTDPDIDVRRIKTDIKDLSVSQLPGIEKVQHIVGVAKHLCGSATDMAIHSLLDPVSNLMSNKVSGFVMATCCHHRCEYSNFFGTNFIEANFKPGEFNVLTKMSSWAVDGNETSRIDYGRVITPNTLTYLTDKQEKIDDIMVKKRIGVMVKDILDFARVKGCYLAEPYSSVIQFTDMVTTVENRAVFANLDSLNNLAASRK